MYEQITDKETTCLWPTRSYQTFDATQFCPLFGLVIVTLTRLILPSIAGPVLLPPALHRRLRLSLSQSRGDHDVAVQPNLVLVLHARDVLWREHR
jgi:hypothetical protein